MCSVLCVCLACAVNACSLWNTPSSSLATKYFRTPIPPPCAPSLPLQPSSVQSFQGTASLQVHKRPFPLAEESMSHLVADVTMHGVAMEFGGGYLCGHDRCQGAPPMLA